MGEQPDHSTPPKWADRALSWFCRDELLEEVRGDLHEFYLIERQNKSKHAANRSYWFHVLHFLRPFAIKRQTQKISNITMYRSYIKTGFRNLKRQRLASFINVFGLATTIAISLVVYVLVDRQFSLDKFHADADRIYGIQSQIDWNGKEETWGRTPILLGPSVAAEIPQIDAAARAAVKRATVKFGENVFRERITLADPSFLEVFNFPIIQGTPEALRQRQQVILSQKAAEKYFGNATAIGQELKVIVNEKPFLFTVSGIAAPFPKTASFQFDFLITLEHLTDLYGTDTNSWADIRQQGLFTFLKLDQPESKAAMKAGLEKFKGVSNEVNTDWPISDFRLQELTNMAQNSQYVREAYASGSTPEILIMFAIISLLLLTSACFNYVNIAVSMAQKRLNEIAVRKVVGGQRKQLITQFLTENFLLCLIATVVGVFIAIYAMLPGVNAIFTSDYSINPLENPAILVFLAVLYISISFISGAYPAFYISGFKPVAILGGKQQLTGKRLLGKVLLTGQFFLTFIAIVAGLLFTSINEFQENQDWGYQAEDLLVVPVGNQEQLDVMRSFAEQSSQITSSAGAQTLIGISSSQAVVEVVEKKSTVRAFNVGPGYLQLLGLKLAEGRDFSQDLLSDQARSVIVNQEFIRKTGLKAPFTGQIVKIADQNRTIIGVVKDFHFDDFFSPITPAIIRVAPEEDFGYMIIKSIQGGLKDTEATVKAAWSKSFPDEPYRGFAQEEVFDSFFQSTGSLKKVMNFVAIVAIILSIMGLFGLASIMIAQRVKEYSIRKIMGANSIQIARLVSKQFVWLLAIALLVAVPSSYFGFDVMFSQIFSGSLDTISVLPFVSAIGILLAVIVLTISSQLMQLLKMNPVNNLRGDR